MAEASPVATPVPYDSVGELDKYLKMLEPADGNNTARARLIYARAELAEIRRKPDERKAELKEIADKFPPTDLSAPLLAVVGDSLFDAGDLGRAAELYTQLKDFYRKSPLVDTAYVGLGEIAFSKKNYQEALDLFSAGADQYSGAKLKEATTGKGKALLELGRYPEAKKVFELVAGMKEWRGESTAFAVYSLGDLEARQQHWPEAIAYFQRVFVLYQKYLPWVARSYVRSAESFDKLGKRPEAIKSLEEMLRNDKLKSFPEVNQAREMLRIWGVTV